MSNRWAQGPMELFPSTSDGPKSVTVLDVILEYRSGHFIPTALSVERAVRFTGAHYTAITDVKCPNSLETTHWLRILPVIHYRHRLSEWRSPQVLLNIFREITNITWILNRRLAENSRISDQIVIRLDLFQRYSFIPIFLALISFKIENFLQSVLSKPTNPMLWLHIHEKGDIAPRVLTLLRMLALVGIRTRVSVYSSALAAIYSAGFPWQVFIIPGSPVNETISRFIGVQSVINPTCLICCGRIVCTLAGQVFPEKGYEIFRKILSTEKKDFMEGTTIQLRAPRGLGLRSDNDRVEIVETPSGQLSEEDYVNTYLDSNFVLMPYRDKYAYSASGVFSDAVTLGCMPIVSRATTMAFELEKFGLKELAIDWNTEFGWNLIAAIARDEGVKDKFGKMVAAYRKLHSLPSLAAVVSDIIWRS